MSDYPSAPRRRCIHMALIPVLAIAATLALLTGAGPAQSSASNSGHWGPCGSPDSTMREKFRQHQVAIIGRLVKEVEPVPWVPLGRPPGDYYFSTYRIRQIYKGPERMAERGTVKVLSRSLPRKLGSIHGLFIDRRLTGITSTHWVSERCLIVSPSRMRRAANSLGRE